MAAKVPSSSTTLATERLAGPPRRTPLPSRRRHAGQVQPDDPGQDQPDRDQLQDRDRFTEHGHAHHRGGGRADPVHIAYAGPTSSFRSAMVSSPKLISGQAAKPTVGRTRVIPWLCFGNTTRQSRTRQPPR